MNVTSILLAVLLAGTAAPPPSPKPGANASPAPPPSREGQLANVRLDVKITDRRGAGEPVTKVVSMAVADRRNGMIRAADGDQPSSEFRPAALNVDASPIIEGNRVRLNLSVEYNVVDASTEARGHSLRAVRQQISVVAESGQPLVVADSAGPIGDRRVQVEVTATIMR